MLTNGQVLPNFVRVYLNFRGDACTEEYEFLFGSDVQVEHASMVYKFGRLEWDKEREKQEQEFLAAIRSGKYKIVKC